MTLNLTKKSSGDQIFKYEPQENQWWITGFDPSRQNAMHENLTSVTTINFSDQLQLWNGFVAENSSRGYGWIINDAKHTATYIWN